MQSRASSSIQSWFTLALASIALTACSPSGNQQIAPAAVSAVQLRSLQKHACETSLRQRMEAGSLRFVASPFSTMTKDVTALNAKIESLKPKKRDFTVDYKNGKTAALKVNLQTSPADSAYASLSTTLSLGEEASNLMFELKVTFKETARKPLKTAEYEQLFGVDTECRLKPLKFLAAECATVGGMLKFEKLSSVLDGRPGSEKHESQSLQVPGTGALSGEMDELDSAEASLKVFQFTPTIHETGSFPIGGHMAIMSLGAVNRSASFADPIEKKTYAAIEIELRIQIGNQAFSAKVAESADKAFYKMTMFGIETWSLPLALWQRATLSAATVAAVRSVDESPARVANENPSSMQIRTTRKFRYSNLDAYWKVTGHVETPNDPDGWLYSYTVAPLPPVRPKLSAPRIASPRESGRSDLLASERVQVDLPEIQQFALQLVRDNPTADRADMAVKILELVNRTITYDNQSVSDWQIQPLKTSDILARRTGVCQHYAVLFASIARAVGIPARIVAGYALLGGPAVAHAWNEIEVAPNTWTPIEPQRTDLKFYSHKYLPMLSGGVFESDANVLDGFENTLEMSRTEFRVRY